VDEEAGFIAAMLAEPDERTTLLVYADWLDERADPRGEYLRLVAAGQPDRARLTRLRRTLDPVWASMIANRHFRVGRPVRILDGPFYRFEGELSDIRPDWQNATVRVIIWGRPVNVELPLASLELIEAPAG
jgi:uncharacterized protein (TIGR02996 family)